MTDEQRIESISRDYFTPYQWKWIKDESLLKLCEKSRRIGMSYATSYRRVTKSLRTPGLTSWVMTRDMTTAKEFIRDCGKWCKLANVVAKGIDGDYVEVVDAKKDVTAQTILFPNGSRIYALSSNPDAAAGKGGDIVLDEFALHGDQALLWQVAEPAAGVWRYQVEIISTHRGKNTLFNQFCTDAKGPDRFGFSFHSINIVQAVEQALIEKINREAAKRGVPAISAEDFIAGQRRRCATDAQWLQEYMCTPQDDLGSLLTYELITGCEAPWHELRLKAPDAPAGPMFLGADIGRKKDLSVFWLLEDLADLAVTREIEVLKEVPFHVQLARLSELIESWDVRRVCIDETGIGMMLAEELQRRFGEYRIEAVTFTAAAKEGMAMQMLRRFQDRNVRVPAEHDIREDLHKVEKAVTAAGNIRYVASSDEDGHADRFWALALAMEAMGGVEGPPRGFRVGRDDVSSGRRARMAMRPEDLHDDDVRADEFEFAGIGEGGAF